MKYRSLGCVVMVSLLSGCIANVANLCDQLNPGRYGKNDVTPYGGVWVQQQTITPLVSPPAPPPFPGGPPPPVVPPPAQFPGSGPVQLQPPLPPPPPKI
jgi:hypothetical protein